jgi:hypothetical protein
VNASFQAVTEDFLPLKPSDDFTVSPPTQHVVPDCFILEVHQIEKQLANINVRKALGPDAIPNWLLQDLSMYLAPAVCSLWNASIRDGYIPPIWKSADVCPLPKVTPPSRVDKDLCPISLTPILCKGLESHIRDWMLDFVKDIMDPHQFETLPGCLTTHVLMELVHLWLAGLVAHGSVVRVLFLDFHKAFDKVNHCILLSKLANLGLPDILVRWITYFLCERKRRVKIGQVTSEWVPINAGVPQGTLTGPTCFITHINDLKTICHHVKFVDDAALWEICDRAGEQSKIQKAADQASEWTQKNLMEENTDKTKELVIYFGKKELAIKPITMRGAEIERVHVFKELGLMINDKLTWEDHIDYICRKASLRLYFLTLLKRAGSKPEDIKDVYVSIIRSVLEYVCEVWHPDLTVAQAHCLEHIQKRALDIAYSDLGYLDALKEAKLEALEVRRESHCKSFFEKLQQPGHKLHYLLPPK